MLSKVLSPLLIRGKFLSLVRKDITIAKLGAGSVIGEVSLLSSKRRTTGVVTSTPLVIVLEINKWHLQSFNSTIQSKFHEQFISILIKRLEDMNKKFGRTKIQSPSDKI